uniref:Putative SUN domain-containing protein 3-like n=1 Tax=Davidia involucrata TaxID=16924 RepID=A0A5B6ZFN5_DAVIN
MSASTVSITANPGGRRRPVVVGEKKSGIELVSGDGGAAAAASSGDKVTSGGGGIGKDLSHSIRGEAVLERSRDLVQVKKALPNSTTVLPRRTPRKVVSKPDKPWWQTVISVLTKNLLLLLVLLGLVQMIYRLVISGGTVPPPPAAGISDLESRIAEVEGFLKSTTKMMQVQVEVVDSED